MLSEEINASFPRLLQWILWSFGSSLFAPSSQRLFVNSFDDMRAMWIWLLCVGSVVALRPEHDIDIHETAMDAYTQKINEKMASSEKDFPVPRCIVKKRDDASRSKHKTSCKAKSETRCKERSEKCTWCDSDWSCPKGKEYWSRWRWTIEPMGEPLTPVQVSEICQSPVPVWRRLSGVSIRTLWRKV